MSSLFEPIKTADVDWQHNLPFSIEYNDIYHSAKSGIGQSRHVFIDGNQLIQRWQALPADSPSHFVIAETGFGTGLNFLLTYSLWQEYAPASAKLQFFSCEQHPLAREDLIKSLSQWPEFEKQIQELIDCYPILTPGFHQLSFANGRIQLILMLGDVIDCYEQLLICAESELESKLQTATVDAWFLDGFAPSKNERMWSEGLFKIIAMLSKIGTSVATYTVASVVKSNLAAHGFKVVKKQGFAPKRHMLTAIFNKPILQKLKQRHTPWHSTPTVNFKNKTALIIGAGLAGCFCAYSLANRGWQVTLIEEKSEVARAASANQQAVLFPKLSAYKSPLTQFMLAAFLFASKLYQKIVTEHDLGALNGALILTHNQKEQLAQQDLTDWLTIYPELGILADAQQSSIISGLPLNQPGLYIPNSGWVDSPALCHFLSATKGVTVLTGTKVENLVRETDQWLACGKRADVVVLANGNKFSQFSQTKNLPIKSIRGQMTSINATSSTLGLKIPLCAEGHVLPAVDGTHSLGASYDLGNDTDELKTEDDKKNIDKIQRLSENIFWSPTAIAHWAAVRATTPDYLPIVGPIPEEKQFIKLFGALESDANRWIPSAGAYYPGLYACTGFGSRGLTTIPLASEWLAGLINNELSCLPRNLVQALSPARFIKRTIVRGL